MLDRGELKLDGAGPRIAEIVLTGGACGGKTTALGLLAHQLRLHGLRVITVPEAFTLMVSGGVTGVGDMVRSDGPDNCNFQKELFTFIRDSRLRARNAAEEFEDQDVVILYDRAELDALAFHDHSCFDEMAALENTTIAAIRDSYDAVLHLVTTASGAEDFYSSVTNAARWETVDEARASDRRILNVWRGNPHHAIIDNSTDFDGKVHRLLEATLAVVAPKPTLVAI